MDAAAVVEPKPVPAALMEGAAEGVVETRRSAVKEDTIVNRETKLALLIGFVAIVVVTVLVGEHFGKARNANPATTDLGTSTAAAPTGGAGPKVDPITSTPVGTPSAPLAPAGNGMGMGNGGGLAGTGAPAVVQPVELTSTGTPVNGGGTTGTSNADKNRFIPTVGLDGARGPVMGSETGVPGTHTVSTLGGNTPIGPESIDNTALTGGGSKPISTGVEKMHPVLKGETLATIAQKYYGDKALARQLGTYNAKRLSANGSVREGVTLRVPPKDVLMGTAVLALNATGKTDSNGPGAAFDTAGKAKASADKSKAEKPASSASDKASTEKTKPTGPRTYVIKKGDTLMSIASRELGSAKRWESLLVANPGLDENSLRTGMTIKIPASK